MKSKHIQQIKIQNSDIDKSLIHWASVWEAFLQPKQSWVRLLSIITLYGNIKYNLSLTNALIFNTTIQYNQNDPQCNYQISSKMYYYSLKIVLLRKNSIQ